MTTGTTAASGMTAGTDDARGALDALADRFWESVLELNPTTATVYGESRSVSLSGGSFTDTFGPYALHIYVVQ